MNIFLEYFNIKNLLSLAGTAIVSLFLYDVYDVYINKYPDVITKVKVLHLDIKRLEALNTSLRKDVNKSKETCYNNTIIDSVSMDSIVDRLMNDGDKYETQNSNGDVSFSYTTRKLQQAL